MSLHFVTQRTIVVSNDHMLLYNIIRLIVLVVNNSILLSDFFVQLSCPVTMRKSEHFKFPSSLPLSSQRFRLRTVPSPTSQVYNVPDESVLFNRKTHILLRFGHRDTIQDYLDQRKQVNIIRISSPPSASLYHI